MHCLTPCIAGTFHANNIERPKFNTVSVVPTSFISENAHNKSYLKLYTQATEIAGRICIVDGKILFQWEDLMGSLWVETLFQKVSVSGKTIPA